MKQYFKKRSNQAHRSHSAGKRSKQDKRWTLLFIGNHGRTVTLKRFKGIVILSAGVLAIAVAVSAGLFVWNQKIIMDNHGLKDELKSLNERLDSLQHDKDILLTRLVVAESRVQESVNHPAEKTETDPLAVQQNPATEDSAKAEPVVAKKAEVPPSNNIESPPSDATSDVALSVAIEDFTILNHTNDQRLKVLFKIKNNTPNSERVSGHVTVVLKGEQTNWLPIPWMPLVDGRPTGQQRGHSFGINYFKTMRLSSPSPKHPEKYQTASVYVFTRKGELLLEQEYPVQLSPNKPQITKPASGVHAIPAEKVETESLPAAPLPATGTPPSPSSLQDVSGEAAADTSAP